MKPQENNYRDVLVKPQPMPVPGKEEVKAIIRRHFLDLGPEIIEDCIYKMEASEKKYGSPLMTHNGRCAALDAYTDLIDTINYLIQDYTEKQDVDEEGIIRMDISRLARTARNIRYRLEMKGVLPREHR